MRLIDADVLKKYIDDCKCCEKCSKKMRNCSDDCEFPDFLTKQWERVIDEQPTVEAEPKWIPSTQKRPERKGMYIVTIINNIGDYITTKAYYSGVEGYEWDGKKVTAWAELPEPYGVEHDQTD